MAAIRFKNKRQEMEEEKDEESCGNCKFFSGESFCRRYPPSIHMEWQGDGDMGNLESCDIFPQIDSDEWCGEWREKK